MVMFNYYVIHLHIVRTRMDVELRVWERKYAFERWEENSIVFQDVKRIVEEEKRAGLFDCIQLVLESDGFY